MFMVMFAFLAGTVVIGVVLAVGFRRDSSIPRVKTAVLSLMLYFYLYVMLTGIVGIPTLSEYIWLRQQGEPVFNPNLNLIPLADGISLSFVLNIFLFVPFGLLCPLVSRTFAGAETMFFAGTVLTVLIEIVQMFTPYRATDIDDLFANVIGTMAGYLCFWVLEKGKGVKRSGNAHDACEVYERRDYTAWIPAAAIITAFTMGFIGG